MIKVKKNINIELLRVVAMLMIIIGHLIGHTTLLSLLPHSSLNYYIISLTQVVSYPATNLYVLISGYLLCEKVFKIQRLVLFWLQVFIYSLIGFFIGVIVLKEFSLIALLKTLLPISGDQYWFARVYFGLYIFLPFLNYLVKGMKKKQHKFCLIICTVVFSLWRSFLPFATTLNPEGGNSILWFFVLYLYGAYIKLYGTKRDYSHPFLISFGFLLFAYASRIGIGLISSLMGWGEKGTSLFTEFTSFPILFSAVFLLIWANSTKTLKSSHVVWFSSSTFSVYLIHENIYIKRIIYRLFDIQSMAQSPLLLFWILLIAVGIFLCCCVIDKGFVSLLLKWLSGKKLFDKLQKKLDTILIGG